MSTLAGVFLWPRFERAVLRRHASKACLYAADLVAAMRSKAPGGDLTRRRESAQRALLAARRAYATTAHRPAGPTRRDRAFVEMLTELRRMVDVVERPFQQGRATLRPCIVEGDRLAASTVQEGKAMRR